jgi:hypothetical protein
MSIAKVAVKISSRIKIELNWFCFVSVLRRDMQADSSNGKRSAEDVDDAAGFVVIEDPHAKRLKSAADNEKQPGSGTVVLDSGAAPAAAAASPRLEELVALVKKATDENSYVCMRNCKIRFTLVHAVSIYVFHTLIFNHYSYTRY